MKFKLLNVVTIILLLILPYYIFEGRMYLGGDDTRLFYSYPLEFLKNVTYFSWYKISSMGINGPSQYLAPFLIFTSFVSFFITSKVVLNYLAFSMPLVLGYIYFQLAIRELFSLDKRNRYELYVGSLFYVLSPILVINQLFVFLISIWLIGLIPILAYNFLRYIRTGNFKYVFLASLWCLLFAFALYAIPWILGFLIPVVFGLFTLAFFFKKNEILYFLKRLIIFASFIVFSQAFWLTGFVSQYLDLGQDSFASKFLSKGFVDTFTPTVLTSATSSIIFPLLNLFHRQIAFDFSWKLKSDYILYYDKFFLLNTIYIFVLAFGIFYFKKYLDRKNQKIYISLLVSFLVSLYFFTVNIGPLKELFILLGQVPGFTMFRNFFDKFAPGYTIIYATIITISLVMISNAFPKKKNLLLITFLLITIINFFPVKSTVNSPLWTTDDISKTLLLPQEYLDFMKYIKKNISSTNNILSIPFGTSAYTVIVDENDSKHLYLGVSPIKIFSGISDISGHYSFGYTSLADVVDGYIINRKYSDLRKVMFEHNINYIMHTVNVPNELIHSYAFNTDLYTAQDERFRREISGKKFAQSTNGNYVLYEAKKLNSILKSENIYFKKISQVKYKIYIKGLTGAQNVSFFDSFHAGWKLYPVKNPSLTFCANPKKNTETSAVECLQDDKIFEVEDLGYFFKQDIFSNDHTVQHEYANKWQINPNHFKEKLGESYYRKNKDGSIDIEMDLYFLPQTYFYFGVLVSVIVYSGGLVYYFKKRRK